MLKTSPFDVFVDDNQITVTVDRSQVEVDELINFVDFLRMQSFLRRNSLSDEEIRALAAEINQKAWTRVKRQLLQSGKGDFLPPEERQNSDE
jgi:hypothetical protein